MSSDLLVSWAFGEEFRYLDFGVFNTVGPLPTFAAPVTTGWRAGFELNIFVVATRARRRKRTLKSSGYTQESHDLTGAPVRYRLLTCRTIDCALLAFDHRAAFPSSVRRQRMGQRTPDAFSNILFDNAQTA